MTDTKSEFYDNAPFTVTFLTSTILVKGGFLTPSTREFVTFAKFILVRLHATTDF
jgi:hypothetical protein